MTTIDLTPDGSRTAPHIDHPTVDVTYPNGETEEVEPEYDIIAATEPREELDAPLDETRVSRLELLEDSVGGRFDKQHIQQDIGTAHGEFAAEYAYPDADVCVELVYYRIVGDTKTLCVQLRGAAEDKRKLSQFALHVDERLCSDLRA